MSSATVGTQVMIVLALSMAAALLLSIWIAWKIRRITPAGICRGLQSGRVVRVRTRYGLGAWNPAEPPGPRNRTQDGPGTASYTLTGDGQVRLDLTLANGQVEVHVGPPVATVGARHRLLALPIAVEGALSIVGASIGQAAGGRSTQARWEGGAIGLVLGILAGWLVVRVAMIVLRGLRTVREEPPR